MNQTVEEKEKQIGNVTVVVNISIGQETGSSRG